MNQSMKMLVSACLVCVSTVMSPSYGQSTAGVKTAAPDFSGVWMRNGGRMGAVKNLSARPDVVIGDYENPILQPWAAAIVKKHAEMEATGFAAPETKQTCWPGGVPNMLSIPSSMELLQTPTQVTILYSNDHQVRTVYMNQPHSMNLKPSWYGESVGHYEGDSLVVDTIGIHVHPMSMIDVFGTPHTEKLHVVERFHVVDKGKTLQVDIQVEDPGAFTGPWTEGASFRKTDCQFDEYVCAENNPLIGIDKSSGEMPRAKYKPPF
jgi:hypothetical protein